MNPQDANPDEKTVRSGDVSSALPSASGLNREEVQTLWGGSIQKGLDATRTIKAAEKRPEGDGTASVSTRLNLRRQTVAEAGYPVEPPPQYEILRVLGEGGMGVVYEARQTSIDRTIALKMIKPEASRVQEHRSKFLSEAVATADLDHPNIVPIHDLGSNEEGMLFYAMKEVRGTSWKDAIQGKPLSDNLDILMRVADAVAFAHSRGVIHRDLKPENVMLGDFGEVMLMDWGLAASVAETGKADRLDRETAIGGTPCYMAPEMACGDVGKIGPASDIYLLGAILYEIVTGKRPHAGDDVIECLVNASQNAIVDTEKEGELVRIARKAMETEPGKRYPHVKEFQAAIREYQIHAQSLVLTAAAQGDLSRAAHTGRYDDYAQAVFGLREAIRVWERNAEAKDGLSAATLAYAERAFGNGDFDLAASLLEKENSAHTGLIAQVTDARRERNNRQRRLGLLRGTAVGLVAVVILVLTVAFFWIRAEQQKALDEKAKAVEARRAEAVERNRAEIESYHNGIALVEKKLEEGAFDQARLILARTPSRLRGWEWGHLMHVCHRDLLTLENDVQVLAVAFSPDAHFAAIGDLRSAKVWDVRIPRIAAELKGHTHYVCAVAFSPDQRRIATGSYDGTAKIWDAKTGTLLRDLKGHARHVTAVAFSPDSRFLATGSWDKTVKIWDVDTGSTVMTLEGHSAEVDAVAFDPAGTRVMSGSRDKTARIWEVNTGKQIMTLGGHASDVWRVAFSPEGGRAITAGPGDVARIWDLSTGRAMLTVQGAWGPVVFCPDGRRFVSNATLRDAETGRALKTMAGHSLDVIATAMSSDGRFLLTGSMDRTAKIWDIESGDALPFAGLSTRCVNAVAFSRDGSCIAIAGEEASSNEPSPGIGMACIWNSNSGRAMVRLRGHSTPATCIAFSPDGRRVITASQDNTATIWDSATGKEVLVLKGHTMWVLSATFSPDGRQVATGAFDGTIRLWDADTGRHRLTIQGQSRDMGTVVFSPDGKWVLGCGGLWRAMRDGDNTAKIWDAERGQEHLTLRGHTDWLLCAAFSSCGRWVATGARDNTARIWSVATGLPVGTMTGHLYGVRSVSFSPDGSRLVTGSSDSTARIWDTVTGRELARLKAHTRDVTSAVFSPDGRRVLTGSEDGTTQLYSALDWTKSVEELEREKRERWQKRWESSVK